MLIFISLFYINMSYCILTAGLKILLQLLEIHLITKCSKYKQFISKLFKFINILVYIYYFLYLTALIMCS